MIFISYNNLITLQSTTNSPNSRRNRISKEIRDKYEDDPEAVIHAAMLLQPNANAKKVHKMILDDPEAGNVFMEAYEKRAKEPAIKMPKMAALGFLLNQVFVNVMIKNYISAF